MTRFDRLKNWPAQLERMTVAELQQQLSFWRQRERELRRREAKQGAEARARQVQAVIDRRTAEK